ncbi:hypothetical protein PC116_g26586 [Phytophthora cactorum]|nr:hypothetical protein PC119_g24484 [Phytophthora cactorum]KAG3153253.1 hypothetical protein PC128_g22616 [Phytophthora cactorum]KAG4224969.1 hypothetical protein PC116_g26586 [Phytophthora cactorum]
MMSVHDVQEDRRGLFRGDGSGYRSKMDHLAESIDEHENACVALRIAGRPKTKYMLTEDHGSVATGSGQSGACFDGEGLTRWHASQERTHLRTHVYMCGQ